MSPWVPSWDSGQSQCRGHLLSGEASAQGLSIKEQVLLWKQDFWGPQNPFSL